MLRFYGSGMTIKDEAAFLAYVRACVFIPFHAGFMLAPVREN